MSSPNRTNTVTTDATTHQAATNVINSNLTNIAQKATGTATATRGATKNTATNTAVHGNTRT